MYLTQKALDTSEQEVVRLSNWMSQQMHGTIQGHYQERKKERK